MSATGDSLPPLREVIDRYELRARKSLGQNFLLDLNLTGRIARAAGDLSNRTVIEIGPGPGGLTRALLAAGARKVIAIERDPRCMAALADVATVYPDRLEVIEADALEADLSALAEPPVRIVANLPYNVATPLLIGWLTGMAWPPFYDRMVLMFQREVAERITAEPGDNHYGRLGVLAGWRCQARKLFDIAPEAFTPPPKVTSSVVELIPRSEPLAPAPLDALQKITAAAFGQRRKMLRASLKSVLPDPIAALEAAGIPETWRAEQVSIEGFCALARIAAAHN